MPGPPLRILAVTNMYPTAEDPAFGVFVASQMESIRQAGHTVEVQVIDGRRGPLAYLEAVRRLRNAGREPGFDLVHAHYGLSGYAASLAPLPFVVSFCGDDLLGTPDGAGGLTWKSRVARRLSRTAARKAAGIICKSEGLRLALPRTEDRERARVIPNGVDVHRFAPGSRADARAALGLPEDEMLVLFPHTSGERRKRLDLAEAAMGRLAARGVEARLWQVAGLPQARMAHCYRAADCLLLTSDWEGSPNVVKEALCCDLPVVSVDAGDVAEWIGLTHGGAIAPRDPEALATALASALVPRRRVDGSALRRTLALPEIAARIVAVYRDALADRRPARVA